MADISALVRRIDAEFSAADAKIKQVQSQKLSEYQSRQERLQRLEPIFDQLREVWKPRLEALVKSFGERVKVSPTVKPSRREATFDFQSKLAMVRLRFSASTDPDVTKVILGSDLTILPVLMQFDSTSQLEMPLDAIDLERAANWIDDRIVSFVKTYLAMHENQYYLKQHLVSDPIAGVEFPDFAAAATLEFGGKQYHFISEETRRQFESEHGISK